MAKVEKKSRKKQRVRSSLLTKLLLLVLLVAVGWQLYDLHGQVADAQAEKERLAAEVETTRQENEALAADIAEGGTAEKKQEIEQAVARQFDMHSTKKNKQNTDENAVRGSNANYGSNAVHSRKEV